MTSSSHDANIVSLACARAEDALAEGVLDNQTEVHLRTCEACRGLADLVVGDGGIVTATAPAPLPAGFVDSVLDQALSDAPRHPLRPATDDLRVAELEAALARRRQRTTWVAAGALVAGLLLAAGAATLMDDRKHHDDDTTAAAPVATKPAAPATTGSPPAAQGASIATPAPVPESVEPTEPTEQTEPGPNRNAPADASDKAFEARQPEAVPEPVLDIPGEIRRSLLRAVAAHGDCPKHNAQPIRVTLGVRADGRIENPQVLSASGHAKAHECVGYAIDKLLLPPVPQAVTVTLDLTW